MINFINSKQGDTLKALPYKISMELQRVRGTEDLKEESQQKHNFIVSTFKKTAGQFCFQEISTPILEFTEVFNRILGAESDIVNKEMFTFNDRNGDSLTLRPEGTAGVARHFITEKLHQQLPLRFLYHGPLFRYERPQKGRLRQFHTVGVELLGEPSHRGDMECISLAWMFLKKLGIEKNLTLEINSIGDMESRNQYLEALLNYLKPLKSKLSANSRKRLKKNPLRILDSKEMQDVEIIQSAPSIQSFLNKRSKSFFTEVLNGLDSMGIPWTLNPLLVRGLDYYNHCVFELKDNSKKLGAQNTVLAGGRYDRLIETMANGGERVHGVGWGAGVERICFLADSLPVLTRPIGLVPLGEEAENMALKLAWELRQADFVVFHPRATSNLRKKMKRANQMQAKYVLIFGPEEIKNNTLSVKNLDTKNQHSISIDQVVSFFEKEINHTT